MWTSRRIAPAVSGGFADASGEVTITGPQRLLPSVFDVTGLATAYVHGCKLNWDRINPGGDYVPLG